MVVPTDLQVRLERFSALGLPFRACTVSTGVERCQRKCTPARFLADSRTLESWGRYAAEQTLGRRSRVRSRRGGRRGGRGGGPRRRRNDARVVLLGSGRLLESAGGRALGEPQVDV